MSLYQQQRAKRTGKPPPPFQLHVVSKDPEWIGQLEFLCSAMRCEPEDLIKDLIPIHYKNLLTGIRRAAQEEADAAEASTNPGQPAAPTEAGQAGPTTEVGGQEAGREQVREVQASDGSGDGSGT